MSVEKISDIIFAAKAPQDVLLKKYKNTVDGYNKRRVKIQRNKYGLNLISYKKKISVFKRLFDSFVNPFNIVLLALAFVSLFTDVYMAAKGAENFTSVIIVMSMVLLSGGISFTQEGKSNKAVEKLTNMVKTNITVKRGKLGKIDISIEELVVGDIVYLTAGDMVPADVRILSAKDLFISQSSLTGESAPVEKFGDALSNESTNPLEYNNLAFMGSNVVSGSAAAVVVSIGAKTMFGGIAKQLDNSNKVKNNFEIGINSISWLLIRFILVMVPIVLFVNGFTKGDWLEATLFAVSVAVGLTPEMLPMIVSTNLAKGALLMSKKKVIVKKLSAIQNFGAMDVLCTDKTGTLTLDKIILEYHLNVDGKEDKDVLFYAFLNSFHQTGLKNLMDISIIEHAAEEKLDIEKNSYKKFDEIPFDFNRRRMSVAVEDKNGNVKLITKGAMEEMLQVCSYVQRNETVEPISKELRNEIIKTAKSLNTKGMRVLALAYKQENDKKTFSEKDESDMILIGYLAFLDPPKEDVTHIIKALYEYGVNIKVLTGDNEFVTSFICQEVGIKNACITLGSDIEKMNDQELRDDVEKCSIFAKLSPAQKARVVQALRDNGHVVGFMGDGINDAVAMKAADVAISVNNAVDIAKESANIILLEKDLKVLGNGIIEGRKTYANTIKYIKMTASSNFGNMFSVLIASAFLPFLPMMPLQILLLNLMYDISCMAIPWDNVDKEYLKKPRKWDTSSIKNFMFWIGPTSSIFDITTYFIMFYCICPMALGGNYATLSAEAQLTFAMMFHTGWFLESIWSQTLVIHTLRTERFPFIKSWASWPVILITSLSIIVGTILPYSELGRSLGMVPLPDMYFYVLAVTILLYLILVTLLKKIFVKKYGELL